MYNSYETYLVIFNHTCQCIEFWKMMSWWDKRFWQQFPYENCGENTRKSSTAQANVSDNWNLFSRSRKMKNSQWWWGTCCTALLYILYHKMGPVSLCFLSHPVLLKAEEVGRYREEKEGQNVCEKLHFYCSAIWIVTKRFSNPKLRKSCNLVDYLVYVDVVKNTSVLIFSNKSKIV